MPAATAIDWTHELIEQLDFHWGFVRRTLDELDDEAYHWEPVPGCWGVRVQTNGRSEMDCARDIHAAPEPPPFTTMAWRLAHIGSQCLGARVANHFGDTPWDPDAATWPLSLAEGRERVDDVYAAWAAGVRGLGADGLARPCGPAEGPFADHPYASLVLHINREVIHHGAEILCLRDLHRAAEGRVLT